MIQYREVAPPPELAGCVLKLWEMNGRGNQTSQRVLPDGCLDIVLHVGRSAHAVGPLLHGLDVPLTGAIHTVGVCVRPGAAYVFLGVPADALADEVASFRDVVGADAGALEEAVERVRPERALAALSAGILDRARGRSADPACAEAVRRLRLTPNLAIPALAADLGLSARQLERRFRAHVGLPPKAFARVARFDRAVRRLGDGTPLALLALDCGYADQAHFSHEFRTLAGMPPRAYVANRQDEDAGTS